MTGIVMGSQTEDRTIREHARALLTPSVGTGKRPCLTVLAGGPSGTVYTLAAEQATVVGRAPDAGLRFEDRRVSRHHAKVMAGSEGNTVLEDLGSSNGTFVNGTRIQSQVLKDGDKIQIGPSAILKFSYQDDVDRSFQQELAERGIKDGLTGIYTEQYFLDRIASEYAHARRHEGTLALLIFEIDHFKNINDTHGVRAGDFILRELARVVSQMLRAEDVFARYGNVSFVVLARDIGDAGVAVLAQRIGRTIKGHEFVFEDTQIPVTISFGIATLSDKAKKPAKLIQIADKYLSRAKKAGQNAIGGRVVKGLAQRNGASTAVPYSKKNRAGGIMSLFDRLTRLLQKRPTPH